MEFIPGFAIVEPLGSGVRAVRIRVDQCAAVGFPVSDS